MDDDTESDEPIFEIESDDDEVLELPDEVLELPDDPEFGTFGKTAIDYSQCSSEHDLITLEDWKEAPPKIFIQIQGDGTVPDILNCYDVASLRQWVSNPENTFAVWVPQPGKTIDAQGFGGQPDRRKLVVEKTVHYISYPIVGVELNGNELKMRDTNGFEFILDVGPFPKDAYMITEWLSEYLEPSRACKYVINNLVKLINALLSAP